MTSTYGAPIGLKMSTSVADSVLPETSTRTVQRAIRSGRIDDDDHLVGGDRDSDSEIEAEGLQETLELLKKGEVYNLGQNRQYIHAPSQMRLGSTQEPLAPALKLVESPRASSDTVTQQQGLQHRSLPPLSRPKASKFKADRSKSGRFSTPTPSEMFTQPTSLHSSSKIPQALAGGDDMKQNEHQVMNAQRERLYSPSLDSTPTIDAPSLTVPGGEPTQSNLRREYIPVITQSSDSAASGSLTSFPSMIVDSPSFPPPGQCPRRPERPPAIVSSRTATADLPTELDAAKMPVASIPSSGINRAESSPIVAPTVLERVLGPRDSVSAVGPGLASGKVSRFKKSRGGLS